MATVRVDDLDLKTIDGVTTVQFGIGGDRYEIDLKPKNLDRLRREFEPFTSCARRMSPFHGTRRGGGHTTTGLRELRRRDSRTPVARRDSAEKREWARANGWPRISGRGRMPKEAEQAWFEHQQGRNGTNAAGDSETP